MSIKGLLRRYEKDCGITVPFSLWSCDDVNLALFINGCGPRGLGDKIIPDKILFISVKPACMVHDFEYQIGVTLRDKKNADERFKNNLLAIVNKRSSFWPLKVLRRHIALGYYTAVKDFGHRAFLDKTIDIGVLR